MFDENTKIELEDVRNIEAAYRWMDRYVMSINTAPPGREEFLDKVHKSLKKINLIESIIHFENGTKGESDA